jgi:hypothetical protein
MKNSVVWLAGVFVALGLTCASAPRAAAQVVEAKAEAMADKSPTAAVFEERAKEYSKLRERIEGEMPKLPKEATPEQIEAHKTAFRERVRAARAGAKPGQLFTPDVARHIRASIKNAFSGADRVELRKTVLEAETQGVAVRINYTYPEAKELVEMPPTLLLRLPQLPKQLRYRFVGQHLLLVDRENGLIVDYMTNALP